MKLITGNEVCGAIREFFKIRPKLPILEWAKERISFARMGDAPLSKFDPMYSPYLVEPLQTWEFDGVKREVTLCGPEQGGKTMFQSIGVLYHIENTGGNFLLCYPSDDDARKMNELKYEPMIMEIPQLAADMALPRARSLDHYTFASTGSKLHFQGAGVPAMGGTYSIVVSDEADKYPKVKNLNNMYELRKRTRQPKSSIFCKVCTPIEKEGKIWTEFLKGSRGYFTLLCLGCGQHTMRSCDFNNLQFETTFDDELQMHVLVPGSIRLICPKCGHAHSVADRVAISQGGKYIHEIPDRVELMPSFQFGALAVLADACCWEAIASTILECGKRADVEAHYYLDNGWKGLPYDAAKHRTTKKDTEALKDHFWDCLPPLDEIENIFSVSDTQDTFSPLGVFAVDIRDNLYLLEYRNVTFLSLPDEELSRINSERAAEGLSTAETVENAIKRRFMAVGDDEGLQPLFHVIDAKGHRTPEVKRFCAKMPMTVMWNGTSLKTEVWKRSSVSDSRSYAIDAKTYQKKLIRSLYFSSKKSEGYFYLPPDLPQKVLDEISSYKPDTTKRAGNLPENWDCGDTVHDAFDVCKMAFWAVDFAREKFPGRFFRIGKAPSFLRLELDKAKSPHQRHKKRGTSTWAQGINGW